MCFCKIKHRPQLLQIYRPTCGSCSAPVFMNGVVKIAAPIGCRNQLNIFHRHYTSPPRRLSYCLCPLYVCLWTQGNSKSCTWFRFVWNVLEWLSWMGDRPQLVRFLVIIHPRIRIQEFKKMNFTIADMGDVELYLKLIERSAVSWCFCSARANISTIRRRWSLIAEPSQPDADRSCKTMNTGQSRDMPVGTKLYCMVTEATGARNFLDSGVPAGSRTRVNVNASPTTYPLCQLESLRTMR